MKTLTKKEIQQSVSRELEQTTVFFKTEFRQLLSTALIVGLGFVIAMVWRDLFVAIISAQMRGPMFVKYPILSEFMLTITVTLIAVFGIYLISRWLNKRLKESAKLALSGMKPIKK